MRLYSKTFLVLALSASFTCGALSLAKAENNDNADMPPVSSFDNNAAYRGLSPEKRTKYNDIMKSTEEAMLPLREKMMAKRLELQSMAAMPNPDQEAIAKLSAEIASLHTQMIKVHDSMADKLSSELGINIGRGTCSDGYTRCSMHQGMRGPRGQRDYNGNYGPMGGYGMGGMMGGYGGYHGMGGSGPGMMGGYHHPGMMMQPMPMMPGY